MCRPTRERAPSRVALRKESVDRNSSSPALIWISSKSLSARRAWIEIPTQTQARRASASLSARRAWIEIVNFCRLWMVFLVALRKESVDRNITQENQYLLGNGRSPQGERG